MSRSYRSIVLAIVGWLILCGAQPPTENGNSEAGTKQKGTTANLPKPATPPAPAIATDKPPKFIAYPGYNPDPCYRAEDKDAADLCAQWRSAVAAEKAAHEARRSVTWAIVASALSLVTIIGLIITIWQTNGALREARRGNRLNLIFEKRSRREARKADADQAKALEIAARNADALAQQVTISESVAKKQLRAYISVQDVVVKNFGSPECKVSIDIFNAGNTPANKLAMVFDTAFVPNPAFEDHFKIRKTIPSDFCIAPSCRINSINKFTISMRNYEEIYAKQCMMVAFGKIEYVDIFGAKWETNFRYGFGGLADMDKDGAMIPLHTGNTAT